MFTKQFHVMYFRSKSRFLIRNVTAITSEPFSLLDIMDGGRSSGLLPQRFKIRCFLPSRWSKIIFLSSLIDSVCWGTARVLGDTRCTRTKYLNWLSRFIDESNVPGAHQVEKVEVWGTIYGSWTSMVQPHHKYFSISFHYMKTVILSLYTKSSAPYIIS